MLNLTFHYGGNKYIQKAHFYKLLSQARSQYQQAQAAETEAMEIEGRIKRSLDLNCNYHKGPRLSMKSRRNSRNQMLGRLIAKHDPIPNACGSPIKLWLAPQIMCM